MRYKIVCRRDYADLENDINHLLNDGWICQGGLCVAGAGLLASFFQAMVKSDEMPS